MITCKKYPFKTRKEAQATLKYRKELPFGTPYRCKICGYWHLGHKWKTPKKSHLGKIYRRKALERRHVKRLLQMIDKMCGVE